MYSNFNCALSELWYLYKQVSYHSICFSYENCLKFLLQNGGDVGKLWPRTVLTSIQLLLVTLKSYLELDVAKLRLSSGIER